MDVQESLDRAAQLRAQADEEERAAQANEEYATFDEFWASVSQTVETETILGLTVPVPGPGTITLDAGMRLESLDLSHVEDGQLDTAIDDLFGVGTAATWHERGMTYQQLGVVMAWAIAALKGRRVTWAEAYESLTTGKAPARLVKERALEAKGGGTSTSASAGSGGQSKPRSQRSTKRRRKR